MIRYYVLEIRPDKTTRWVGSSVGDSRPKEIWGDDTINKAYEFRMRRQNKTTGNVYEVVAIDG